MTTEELNQQFSDKVKRGIFRPVDRFISDRAEAEDRLQDSICQAWEMFVRYGTEKDKVLDDGILVHKCRLSATDKGRRFVKANGARCRNQDTLDPRAYQSALATVLRLDWEDVDEGRNGRRSEEVGLAREVAADPTHKLNSALDLEQWLGTLSHRDRHIMEGKWLGVTTRQIAHDLDLNYLTAWRLEKQLGRDLATRAGVRITSKRRTTWRPHQRTIDVPVHPKLPSRDGSFLALTPPEYIKLTWYTGAPGIRGVGSRGDRSLLGGGLAALVGGEADPPPGQGRLHLLEEARSPSPQPPSEVAVEAGARQSRVDA